MAWPKVDFENRCLPRPNDRGAACVVDLAGLNYLPNSIVSGRHCSHLQRLRRPIADVRASRLKLLSHPAKV